MSILICLRTLTIKYAKTAADGGQECGGADARQERLICILRTKRTATGGNARLLQTLAIKYTTFENLQCVIETEILVEQQPPKGVFICDHAGLVIKRFSPKTAADGCTDRDGAGVYDRL